MSTAQSPIRKINMLFTQEIWEKYVNRIEDKFRLKTYPQFDPYFDFPKEKDKLLKLVFNEKKVAEHSFLPFVKILIKTPRYRHQENDDCYCLETKIRPISFASHFDTYIYGFYSFAINELYQDYIKKRKFDSCVLAYRNDLEGKCNIQFAKEVFDIIKIVGQCSAIALDISGYFDSIDHSILKEKWCKIIDQKELPADQYKIYRSLTKYCYINKNSLLKHFNISLSQRKKKKERWITLLDLIPDEISGSTFNNKMELLRKRKLLVTNKPQKNKDGTIRQKGIPQGTSMSALLSNIYLIDFDEYLNSLAKSEGFYYKRYCDDIMIICKSDNVDDIKRTLSEELNQKYRLKINDRKTEIVDFRVDNKGKLRSFNHLKATQGLTSPSSTYANYKNLQYLGFEFNGQNVYIRPSSLSRYFRKMKNRITKTIIMAYSSKSKSQRIFKQQLFHRYSHLGTRNFLSYAINASKKCYKNSEGIVKEGFDSLSIRRQVSSHFSILQNEISKTSGQIAKKMKAKFVKV